MEDKKKHLFRGYEYKEIQTSGEQASMYVDCYENFGWELDDNFMPEERLGVTKIRMKRDRKIINKMELTRLQRHFEACADEIEKLEQSKSSIPTMWALVIAIIGTAFMAGSVFAIVGNPPIYWLSVLLGIPACIGWILPYFVYCKKVAAQTKKVQPLIEAKYDEIYEICEKGNSLL